MRKITDKRVTIDIIENYICPKFKIDDSGCWEWYGTKLIHGYSHINILGKSYRGHRLIYSLLYNKVIPDDMHCDHLCRNRRCVNPKHIEIVTPLENSIRGISIASVNFRKTHCVRGHEFTHDNTFIFKRGGNSTRTRRTCRECSRIRCGEWKKRTNYSTTEYRLRKKMLNEKTT